MYCSSSSAGAGDAFFQDARFHVGMADGAEEDDRKFTQVYHGAVRQDFLGCQVAVAAKSKWV